METWRECEDKLLNNFKILIIKSLHMVYNYYNKEMRDVKKTVYHSQLRTN